MARMSGKDATIAFASGYAVGATDWTIDIEVEDVDTTALGDSWRTHLNGLQAWSGSYTAQVESTAWDSNTGMGIGIAPASATFTVGSGPETLAGNIMITGSSVTATVGGGANTISWTFVGSGALTAA